MSAEPTEFERQYRALLDGTGVSELRDWSSISVSGADRLKFLQNFCTNDVKQLAPGDACEAFFLNVKGKIIGHGLVTGRENELVIVGAPGQSSQLVAHLDRYVIREDVQLQNITGERRYFVSCTSADVASVLFPWQLINNALSRVFEVTATDIPALTGHLRERGLQFVESPALEAARIEAGVPLFGIDFTSENLPQEVGRDRQAINFQKGCYLGQETVARIDALGHVNQRIVGVCFFDNELPRAGTELKRNGATVGHVTSSIISPQLGAPLALAMVRREAVTPRTRLESAAGPCEVIELPLPTSDIRA